MANPLNDFGSVSSLGAGLSTDRCNILSEVNARRDYQVAKWGDDDTRSETDFLHSIIEYVLGKSERTKNKELRKRLIDVAALAVAAVEKIDRRDHA